MHEMAEQDTILIFTSCWVAPALCTRQTQLYSQCPGSSPSESLCRRPPRTSALCRLQASWAWCHSMSSPEGSPDLACQPASGHHTFKVPWGFQYGRDAHSWQRAERQRQYRGRITVHLSMKVPIRGQLALLYCMRLCLCPTGRQASDCSLQQCGELSSVAESSTCIQLSCEYQQMAIVRQFAVCVLRQKHGKPYPPVSVRFDY